MSPEEKLEMGRKLIAEAEAEIAAKKRNWREEAEPGMLFRSYGKVVAIPPRHPVDYAISMDPEHIGTPCYGWEEAKDLAYLGHARDRIKIAEPEREPTGAELACAGCGLKHGKEFPKEPTVQIREDSVIRCADCEIDARRLAR